MIYGDPILLGGGNSGGLNPSDALIHANAPLGSTVEFAKGGVTVETITPDKAFANDDGETADYYYPVKTANYGTWTVTATLSSDTASDTVVVDSAEQYDANLTFASPLNMLTGASWANGYIKTDGYIGEQDAGQKERYTIDYLPATPGYYVMGIAALMSNSGYWTGIGYYNSGKGWQGRLTISAYGTPVYDSVSGLYLYLQGIQLPQNTAFIRYSARTYGEGYAFFARAEDFMVLLKSGKPLTQFVDMWA